MKVEKGGVTIILSRFEADQLSNMLEITRIVRVEHKRENTDLEEISKTTAYLHTGPEWEQMDKIMGELFKALS